MSVAAGGSGLMLNLGGATSSGGAGPVSDCPPGVRNFIYVMDSWGTLSRFSPTDKALTRVGVVRCSTELAGPTLAVDRQGNAYVDYEIGQLDAGTSRPLYEINTEAATCAGEIPGFSWLGAMAFASNGATETLYVVTGQDDALGAANLSTGTVEPIGPIKAASSSGYHSLTGTGDGRLFDFVVPVGTAQQGEQQIVQLDPTNASVLSRFTLPSELGTIQNPTAFWGGKIYIFYQVFATQLSVDSTTSIAQYDPATNAFEAEFMSGITQDITAAAVSSCAPLVDQPK